VSVNPFKADPAVGEQLAWLENERGDAIRGAVGEALSRPAMADPGGNMGGVLPKQSADRIAAENDISTETLMLLSLGIASGYARPRISNFTVGAVGLEAETENLVFGGNLEFPGASIANTVHAEGFVFARAFSRGTSIKTIAIGEAHPCAFCRQFLSEFAATQALTLIDPLGHRLTMEQLYPWPFDPAYLGQAGVVAGKQYQPTLELSTEELGHTAHARLLASGRKSYVPYGKAPAAVALTLRKGVVVAGGAIESVSFNPSMHPLPAALIDLRAHGYDDNDIVEAAIAIAPNAPVDYLKSTRDLLGAVAPNVPLTVLMWTA
jgi:cytidine deaminase